MPLGSRSTLRKPKEGVQDEQDHIPHQAADEAPDQLQICTRHSTFLGFVIKDTEKTQHRFGASTRAAVIEFQTAHQLEATGLVDEVTAATFNTVLTDKGAFDAEPGGGGDLPTPDLPSDDTLFSVQGEVVKPDGTPMANQIVRAYDRALCEWRLLGNADATIRTNDLGRYRISYEPAQLKAWASPAPTSRSSCATRPATPYSPSRR